MMKLYKSIPILLITTFFMITILIGNVHAWSWSDAKDYVNAYNISITNWNYTAIYGSNTYYGSKAGFALINISNVINPYDIGVLAYGKSGDLLGKVPNLFLNQYGSNSIFLLANRTLTGSTYTNATVFYNRIDIPFSQQIVAPLNNYVRQLSYNGIKVFVLQYNPNLIPCLNNQSCVSSNLNSHFLNIKSTNITSNSAFYQMNFTLNTSALSSFVLLSNKSLNARYFNQTWFLGWYQTTQIYSKANAYTMQGLGLFGGIVNTPSISSNRAFKIFNSLNNYEGYYARDILNNQIITDELTENSLSISNIIASVNRGTNINIRPYFYNLKIDTSANTTFYILPSFSSTFNIIGNQIAPIVNPNPQDINGIGTNPSGWYYNFVNREQIKNINWSSNSFTTFAFPTNQGIAHKIIVGTNGIPYLMLNITHYRQMGDNCQFVYIRDYNNLTDSDFGAIPFSVNNCNKNNSIASFILDNKTTLGFVYNSFYIYWNSPFNLSSNFGNPNTINNWIFQPNSNSFSILISNTPFILKLSSPLNVNSNIINRLAIDSPDNTILKYNGFDREEFTGQNPTNFNVIDKSGFLFTSLLFLNNTSYYTKDLSSYWANSPTNIQWLSNQTNSVGFSAVDIYKSLEVNLFNSITANAIKLYVDTSHYKINSKVDSKPNSNLTNITLPNTPTTIPQTITHINYSNISISSNILASLGGNIQLFDGFNIPQYVLLIMALIIIIIAGITLEVPSKEGQNHHANLGFLLILSLLWIMSIWQIQLLILVVIISIIFIAHEFIHKKEVVA